MTFIEQRDELEEFRIALVLPWSRTVLAFGSKHHLRLPRLTVPIRSRTAQQLQKSVQTKWRTNSIVIDFLPESGQLPSCAIVEVLSPEWAHAEHGLTPTSVDDLDEHNFTDRDRCVVKSIITRNPLDRGPFSRIGWLKEAEDWVRESISDGNVCLNGDIQQVNAGGFFSLVRFGTDGGPAYWLKATGEPNLHELVVTQTIAFYCSQFLPPLTAVRKDWNAWITEEFGIPISENYRFHEFELATDCLAKMQVASTSHVDELLANNCFDHRTPMLREHFPEVLRYLEDAMSRQTSTKVPPLTSSRLREIVSLLDEACKAIETIGIPDALIHNDMNAGNILCDGTRAVFTDWSEATVGNPFMTFLHLQAQASEVDSTQSWAALLEKIYRNNWRDILSDAQINKAFALSPPLAVASYLCGRDPSFTSAYRRIGSVQSYARSLARHMDRLARVPEFLEALCH